MNKIFDKNRISTFKNLKDLTIGNKLVGRRNIVIAIDERAIDELRNYVYKAEIYDEKEREIKKLQNIIDREIPEYIENEYGMLDCTYYFDYLERLEKGKE